MRKDLTKAPEWRELRDYQDEGIDFLLSHEQCGLFFDMGMGKTGTILHALLEVEGPTLLVGPIRVIETVWRQECDVWPALRKRQFKFSLIRGKPKEREKALLEEADIYLANPEILDEILDQLVKQKRRIPNLIIDESTLYKNPSSQRFKRLRKRLRMFSRRVILTGTPNPNSLMDLWSQIFILDQGERLDTAFSRFRQTYFRQVDFMGYEFEAHEWAEEKITQLISDIIYRVEAPDDGTKLPPNIIRIPLPPDVMRKYREMEKFAFARIDEDQVITASTAAVVSMKLRQFASGVIYGDEGEVIEVHTEKIKALRSVLDESGSPVIVVYQFTHELEILKKAFPKGVVFDSEHVEPWNAGKIPLMFLHPQTGGHGLNLQFGGHIMVVYSGSFSLEQMMQVRGRLERPGQKFLVLQHFLVAIGTIDELIVQILERKAKDQASVLKLLKEYALEKKNADASSNRRNA